MIKKLLLTIILFSLCGCVTTKTYRKNMIISYQLGYKECYQIDSILFEQKDNMIKMYRDMWSADEKYLDNRTSFN